MKSNKQKLLPDERVHKPNPLIGSFPILSFSQQKAFAFMLYKAFPDIKNQSSFTVKMDEFVENVFGYKNHSKAKETIKKLMEPRFIHGSLESKEWEMMSYISYFKWNSNENLIEFEFPERLKNYIRAKDFQYTSIDLKILASLDSKYSSFLWQLCLRYRNLGKTPKYEINQFKKHLGVENYCNKDFFKRLKKWLDEILHKTEILLILKKDRPRNPTKIWFEIKTKPILVENDKDKLFILIKRIVKDEPETDRILRLYPSELILKKITKIELDDRIKHKKNYLLKTLENNKI